MLTVDLYPYQESAVDLVLDLGYGLVAYEMGLGKTLVGIAVAEEMLAEPCINFALIVVPSSLKWQWAESIAKFTDVDTMEKKVKKESITIPTQHYCVVIDGPPDKRAKLYDAIEADWPNFVICTYEQVVNDFERIKGLAADLVILDEATAIKGFKAQRTKAVKALDPDYAVALSGTPLENRPEEVYSIMEFVCPGYLGRFDTFDTKYIVRNNFGGVERYRNLDLLHERLSKVMARKTRLDPEVAPYMPDVEHAQRFVGLSGEGKKLYKYISSLLLSELEEMSPSTSFDMAAYYKGEGGSDMTAQGKIMAKVMALQMLCDHPILLRSSAIKYRDSGGEMGSKFAYELLEAGRLETLGGSEKFDTVVQDVRDILDSHPENKVIIFSFFKDMVRMLDAELRAYDPVQFTGDMNTAEKAAAKARFQQNPECRVFIASDAGGYGVDLPQANYLINYDLAESAGTMDQRNARHVRAGSKHKNVYVINYLVEGSIEERTFTRLEFKRSVSRAVIDGRQRQVDGTIENNVVTLTDFLSA